MPSLRAGIRRWSGTGRVSEPGGVRWLAASAFERQKPDTLPHSPKVYSNLVQEFIARSGTT